MELMTNEEVEKRSIFLGVVGSTAYGTNIPGSSDEDFVGVCIPSIEYYFGMKKFEQADKWTDENGTKIDKVIYSVDKAIKLMAEANPNMLDLLFLPERCLKIVEGEWEAILRIRDSFISKKCRYTYSGYAHSQLERISTHQEYLRTPVDKPLRSKFDLPEKSVFPDTQYHVIANISTDFIDEENKEDFYREITQIIDNEMSLAFAKYIKKDIINTASGMFRLGQKEFLRTLETISSKFLKDEFREAAHNELRYLSAYNNWKRYEDWKKKRNPKRAILEAKCGYDSKHASHLLRLLRMGNEILEGKGVLVDRTNIDAEELRNIRLGNVNWGIVKNESDVLFKKLDESYEKSTLRHSPDFNLIEETKIDIIERYHDDVKSN